nr:glycoside hydrolase family 16 protein [Gammaproteobacteria bacterium]
MKVFNLTFFLSFLFINFSFAQDWNLVWEDEFNGSSLDGSKWVQETGTGSQYGLWGWGNGELQYYKSQNTTVSNGSAKIIARQESAGGMNYTSSRMKTDGKFTFRYGKVQAKMKTVEGEGFWPAFWLLPSGGGWPCDGEIDIMEQWANNGNTTVTTGAAHVGACPGGSTYKHFNHNISGGSYADAFHIYEIRWYPDYIAWYVDDVKVYQITPSDYPNNQWPFNSNEWYLILNLAITGSGPNANTAFPSQIEVDWVRVYQSGDNDFEVPVEVFGCLDSNATNYNASATDQAQDEWGNALCTYASCNDVPTDGCKYSDAFAAWHEHFSASDCTNYGGTPCEGGSSGGSGGSGCLDANAINYNAGATVQAEDEWSNILCTYASCDDVPSVGCMYANAFAGWHESFGAADCSTYGGTPCEGGTSGGSGGSGESGCIDSNAVNYDANATVQTVDENGNEVCTYTSCNDVPSEGGCIYATSFGNYNEYFGASECAGYGGTPCDGGTTGGSGGSGGSGCLDSNADNYNAEATVQGLDQYGNLACDYTSCDDIPDAEGCMYAANYSAFHADFTAANCEQYGGTACTADVHGCMDANASNYDAAATVAGVDQYGNSSCIYTSCDDIPDAEGCMYGDAYAPYNEWFTPDNCTSYGGTACVEAPVDVEGCLDANADNYNADATVQGLDQYGNLACDYTSCDDIPDAEGCMYTANYSAFNADFTAANCEQYGGTACTVDVHGCMDANASNYDAAATVQAQDQWGNLLCVYGSCDAAPSEGCVYAESFGAFADGFGPAECSTYGGTPCVDAVLGCLDANADNYDAAATDQAQDEWGNIACNYSSCDDIPDAEGCMYTANYSAFHADFTADNCVQYGGTACVEAPVDVEGCLDANADNYNADATVQGLDQWGNLACNYSSCDDIPDAEGCMYAENYSAFNADFTAANCEQYGGTACVEEVVGVEGCLDANATNYNTDATVQSQDQWGNLLCVYTSCDNVPAGGGCMYAESFGVFAEGFGATECKSYGGTQCVEGCLDANATNYNADATVQSEDQWGNLLCVYTSCDVAPSEGCVYAESFGAFADGFGPSECSGYGGTPCTSDVHGCTDDKATNYDALATVQAEDQYGNLLCVYTSCDDVPDGEGCMYAESFGAYHEEFNAAACAGYGGTPCGGTGVVNVTFQVDMSAMETHAEGVYLAGGAFGQDGHLLTDNGSDVWSVTVALASNTQHLYKFRNQPSFGTWDGFEDPAGLISGGCNTGGYNDRFVDVVESDITLDVVAYGSCTAEAPTISGCTDATASNYNADATEDDGSCVTIPSSPVPTAAADAVLSIFSDAYTNVDSTDFNPGWGQSTQVSVGDVLTYSGLNYQGTQFANQDVSAYGYLHVDYYTTNATNLSFYLISPGAETPVELEITLGQWSSIDIPLTSYSSVVNLSDAFQFKVVGDGDVYLDNLYFGGEAPAPVLGCTDTVAENYNAEASQDDDSCTYNSTAFCNTYVTHFNFDDDAYTSSAVLLSVSNVDANT